MRSPAAILLLWMLPLLSVHAQQPRGDVSVEEIVNALTPPARTRSLARNLRIEPARIDLVILFDFNSARVRDESRPQLERLAEALKNERLSSLKFQVEGHTDAQGTAAYNDDLSARRAQAVATILQRHGVPMHRLQSVGKGFTELLDPADPKGASNRRVRILTLDE
jgi:outer membrane protein OmpA-like peptidoglycan-associated protein